MYLQNGFGNLFGANLDVVDTNELRQFSQTFWVYSCVNTICDEVTAIDWDIVPKEDIEYDQVSKKIKGIKEWMQYPNANRESFTQVIRAFLKDIMELDAGVIVKVFDRESYDYDHLEPKSGAPMLKPKGERHMTEISARDGSSFLKEVDKFGFCKGFWQYSYQIPAHPMWFNREEIGYLSRNLRSMSCYGFAPTQAVLDIIKSLHYSLLYNKRFFEETTIPDGVLSIPDTNETELKNFADGFVREFKAQPHKFALFNKEVKWTPFTVSNKELEFLQTQSWYYKLVISAFGLTPAELGITDDLNRSTAATQAELSRRKGIRPLLGIIEKFINEEIMSEFDNNDIEFQFIYDDPTEKQMRLGNWKLELDMGVKTINEVRNEMGLQPVNWGESPSRSGILTTGSVPVETGGSEAEADGEYKQTLHREEAMNEAKESAEKPYTIGYDTISSGQVGSIKMLKSLKITEDLVNQVAQSYNYKGDLNELRMGLEVEQEHEDVVGNDINMIAKIALAHLNEMPDYYTKLKQMEGKEAIKTIEKALNKALSDQEKREIIEIVYGKLSRDLYLILQRIGMPTREAARISSLLTQRGRLETEKGLKKGKKEEGKKLLGEFEYTIAMAELKALSKLSLERPLSNEEYNRMMELGRKLGLKKGWADTTGQYYHEPSATELKDRGKVILGQDNESILNQDKPIKNQILCPNCGRSTLMDEIGLDNLYGTDNQWRCTNCNSYFNYQELLDQQALSDAEQTMTSTPKDQAITAPRWSPKELKKKLNHDRTLEASDLNLNAKEFVGFDYGKEIDEINDYIDSGKYRRLISSYLSDLKDEDLQKILEVIRNGLTQGSSLKKIKQGISEIIKDETRADAIARTEVVRIANEGFRREAEKKGVKEMIWISAPEDGRLCDKCKEMNGKILTIEKVKEMIDKKQFPPHVNCRCRFTEYIKLK